MGFSLNSLEAEQLKHALQRDRSVSESRSTKNKAFIVTKCSHVLEHSQSETASNLKWVIFYFIYLNFHGFYWLICIGKTMQFCLIWQVWQNFIHDLWQYTRHEDRGRGGERMDGRMLDRGQVEMEGVGRSPPPRDVCGSQAKEMLQPRREGSSTWVTLTSPAGAGFCGVQITHF